MIQVNASNEVIQHRIDMFIKRKREAINHGNVRDFCRDRGPGVKFSTCARVDAVLVPRKDSKSHLKVRRVLNKWGPQISGMDPGSGDVKPEGSTAGSSGIQTSANPNIGVSYPGIEERIQNVEKYLQVTNGPVPRDIYTRLKQVEDKILYLESISPEYSTWGQPQPEPIQKDTVELRKKSYTVMDIAQRIKEMERSLAKNEDN